MILSTLWNVTHHSDNNETTYYIIIHANTVQIIIKLVYIVCCKLLIPTKFSYMHNSKTCNAKLLQFVEFTLSESAILPSPCAVCDRVSFVIDRRKCTEARKESCFLIFCNVYTYNLTLKLIPTDAIA